MELINAPCQSRFTLGNQGESASPRLTWTCTSLAGGLSRQGSVTFIPPDVYQTKLLPAKHRHTCFKDGTTLAYRQRNMTHVCGQGQPEHPAGRGDDRKALQLWPAPMSRPATPQQRKRCPRMSKDWVDAAIAKLAEVDPAILGHGRDRVCLRCFLSVMTWC